MKHTCWLSILIILGLYGHNNGQTILFQDNFDSYPLGEFPTNTWVLCYSGTGTQNQFVVSDEYVSPYRSLSLEGAPNWAGNAHRLLPFTPPVIYAEAYMLVKTLNNNAAISFKNPDIGSWGTYYASLSIGSLGKILLNDIMIGTCEANTWYHVKLMYDSQKDLCNAWINGELMGVGIACPTNGEYTAICVQSYHPTSSTRAWFDDIIVYTYNTGACITSIKDVPDDQGKQVEISWNSCSLDVPGIAYPVSEYTIWRLDDVMTYITRVPALQLDQYAVIAPTLHDSCGTGCNYTSFQVVSHISGLDINFISEPDSGYSVNNNGSWFYIGEKTKDDRFLSIYPNPAVNIVNCQLSVVDGQMASVSMLDLSGRVVDTRKMELKSPGKCSLKMDVSEIPAGIYLIKLQAGEEYAVRKLVVK